jgi:hypothetical protein
MALTLVACSADPAPVDAGSDAPTLVDRVAPPVDGGNAAGLDVARDAPPVLDRPTDGAALDVARDVAAVDAPTCPSATARCGGACVDLSSDRANCGACGRACAFQGASAMCTAGRCVLTACEAGRGNCDGLEANGCETDTNVNLAHCGACGRACAPANATGTCGGGLCRPTCAAGFGNCDGADANGCETDTNVNLAHCGACGRACTAPANGTASCRGGACEVSCGAGFCAVDGRCVAGTEVVVAPRLLAPLSTSTVTSRRPTLLWELPTGVEGARVEVCLDRACTRPVTAFNADGAEGRPSVDLPDGVLFWRLRGRVRGCTGTPASATWQFVVPHRRTGVDSSWGTAPDVNGDGYTDLIVGARGAVYVYPGSAAGLASSPVTLNGPSGVAGFGRSLSAAGDVNGDGFGDVVVGTDGADRVYLYAGGAAGLAATPTPVVAPAGVAGFGRAVAAAGDIDGDGYGDVVVGAETANAAYVFRGSATGLTASPIALRAGGMGFGASVREAGDVDGDGLSDVIVGAPTALDGRERAFIFRGVDLATVTPLERMTTAGFGHAVAGAGDVNADGRADVIVGTRQGDIAEVFAGSAAGVAATALATFRGTGNYGASVAGAGDVNGDGIDDLIVGAPGGMGYVEVWQSEASMPHRAARRDGGGGLFGAVAAGVGDVNRDGFDDCAVGAPGAGRVLVFLGARAGVASTALTVNAPSGATDFGTAIARGPF